MAWGWFSANEDGEVVAKTDVQDDGTVNRYDYTVPDHIEEGHGDKWYKNMDDFMDDKPLGSRDKNDPSSINRSWKGPGYDLDISIIDGLSVEELNYLKYSLNNSILYSQNHCLLQKLYK